MLHQKCSFFVILFAVLPEEKSVDLNHMLQELHQNSDKIFQLQDGEHEEF